VPRFGLACRSLPAVSTRRRYASVGGAVTALGLALSCLSDEQVSAPGSAAVSGGGVGTVEQGGSAPSAGAMAGSTLRSPARRGLAKVQCSRAPPREIAQLSWSERIRSTKEKSPVLPGLFRLLRGGATTRGQRRSGCRLRCGWRSAREPASCSPALTLSSSPPRRGPRPYFGGRRLPMAAVRERPCVSVQEHWAVTAGPDRAC
jgi:hypothetical protein